GRVFGPGPRRAGPARARGTAVRLDHATARSLRRLHADIRGCATGVLRSLGARDAEARGALARFPVGGRGRLLHDRHGSALQPTRLGLRGPGAGHVLAWKVGRGDPCCARRARPPGSTAAHRDHVEAALSLAEHAITVTAHARRRRATSRSARPWTVAQRPAFRPPPAPAVGGNLPVSPSSDASLSGLWAETAARACSRNRTQFVHSSAVSIGTALATAGSQMASASGWMSTPRRF